MSKRLIAAGAIWISALLVGGLMALGFVVLAFIFEIVEHLL